MNRLKNKYEKEIIPALVSEFKIGNILGAPKVKKVVVNVGVGEVSKNKEGFEQLKKDLAAICGQIPQVRSAKVSVASFGVRRGMTVGLKVTLRGERMYSFLDKLFSIVLPRLRDFRGVSRDAFDQGGNYTIGFVEHTVFPEVDTVKMPPHGMEITIVIDGGDVERSRRLLEIMGMPFIKSQNS